MGKEPLHRGTHGLQVRTVDATKTSTDIDIRPFTCATELTEGTFLTILTNPSVVRAMKGALGRTMISMLEASIAEDREKLSEHSFIVQSVVGKGIIATREFRRDILTPHPARQTGTGESEDGDILAIGHAEPIPKFPIVPSSFQRDQNGVLNGDLLALFAVRKVRGAENADSEIKRESYVDRPVSLILRHSQESGAVGLLAIRESEQLTEMPDDECVERLEILNEALAKCQSQGEVNALLRVAGYDVAFMQMPGEAFLGQGYELASEEELEKFSKALFSSENIMQ